MFFILWVFSVILSRCDATNASIDLETDSESLDDYVDKPKSPFNQYTVDQLLIKVPSILEEPHMSDSTMASVTFQIVSNESASNQNLFLNARNTLAKTSKSYEKKSKFETKRGTNFKPLLEQNFFNCSQRAEGYYADVSQDCHIFHYCKSNGFKFTFICPGNSVFNQELLTCDNSMKNPQQTCQSSQNFYFLNSMIYAKNTDMRPISLFQSNDIAPLPNDIDESDLAAEKNHLDKLTSSSYSSIKFLETSTSTATTTAPPLFFEKKLNEIKYNEPLNNDIILPGYSQSFKKSRPNELLNLLITSPSPPIGQIDTPEWFAAAAKTTNLTANDLAHLDLETTSLNIYSEPDIPSVSIDLFPTKTKAKKEKNENDQIFSRFTFGDQVKIIPKLSESHDRNNLLKKKKQNMKSKESFYLNQVIKPILNGSNKRSEENQKLKPESELSIGKHKIGNPFNIDWDDDDQMLVEEFRQKTVPVKSSPIIIGHENTNDNYLYGKPFEQFPDEALGFNPISFETLLENMPPEMHTLPLVSPSMLGDQQLLLTQFGPLAEKVFPQVGNSHSNSVAQQAGTVSPKSQFGLFLANFIGNSNDNIGRRWFKRQVEPARLWRSKMQTNYGKRRQRINPIFATYLLPYQNIAQSNPKQLVNWLPIHTYPIHNLEENYIA